MCLSFMQCLFNACSAGVHCLHVSLLVDGKAAAHVCLESEKCGATCKADADMAFDMYKTIFDHAAFCPNPSGARLFLLHMVLLLHAMHAVLPQTKCTCPAAHAESCAVSTYVFVSSVQDSKWQSLCCREMCLASQELPSQCSMGKG